MNINLTVTHTVAPDVLALLQQIAKGTYLVPETTPKNGNGKVKKLENVEKSDTAVTPAGELAQETKTETTTEVKEISDEDLRAYTNPLIEAGKRDEIKKLIAGFGVKKMSEIPQEKRAEFIEKVKAL